MTDPGNSGRGPREPEPGPTLAAESKKATVFARQAEGARRDFRRGAARVLGLALGAALLAVVHHGALGSLAGSSIIAKLLAPNLAEAAQAMVIGSLFLVLRIFVLAFLPGIVLGSVGVAVGVPLVRLAVIRIRRRKRSEAL